MGIEKDKRSEGRNRTFSWEPVRGSLAIGRTGDRYPWATSCKFPRSCSQCRRRAFRHIPFPRSDPL